jgi:hypothetical protein
MTDEVVFLFDVDNTLFDNDRFQRELREHLEIAYGAHARERYWAHFDALWEERGYADYLGALALYRLEEPHNPALLQLGEWLLDYPFAENLYPGALEAVHHASQIGRIVVLSDGDAVFQPRKVMRSGLWRAFAGNVLIYVHKQMELPAIERAFPAGRYVLVDHKLAILDAVKKIWGDRVATIFPRQGHYAFDPKILSAHPPADLTIGAIAELTTYDLRALGS